MSDDNVAFVFFCFVFRREHLSEEDVQKNKAALESLSKGDVYEGNIQVSIDCIP